MWNRPELFKIPLGQLKTLCLKPWPWCVHVNIYHMFEKPDTTTVYIHISSIITFLILFGPHAVKQKNAM